MIKDEKVLSKLFPLKVRFSPPPSGFSHLMEYNEMNFSITVIQLLHPGNILSLFEKLLLKWLWIVEEIVCNNSVTLLLLGGERGMQKQ